MAYKKIEVSFESPTKSTQQCSYCRYFEVNEPERCEIVAGTILDTDWCRKFDASKK